MDKTSAQNLIKETFNYPFKEEKFSKFSVNLLEQIKTNSSSAWQSSANLPLSLKENVMQYKIIGQMEYENGEKIIIAMIKLISAEVVEKSRYIQRDFTKWLIDKNDSDACLVSFFADNYDDWRFSLVKIDYKREETKTGKIKVKQELTPLRRYSYLVGKNEPNHTAQTQLSPLLLEKNKNPSVDKLTEAFSVEKVNMGFFENYRDLCFDLEKEIKKLRKNDKILNLNFKENKINDLEFSKKTMGQIVFIYFIQKKNWVGHKFINNNYDRHGPKNFLNKLYNSNETKEYKKYKNFFNDILEPLFYDGFAKRRKDNLFKKLNCFVPFLSSELFEPLNNYDWEKTEILIKNEIFKKIFEIFDRYNFTVREEEPLEIEVAIDPEMLGKVLENLLPDKEKRLTGTFYTPRPIVNYMCNQAIENFLKIHFDKSLGERDLKNLILISDTDVDSISKKNIFSKNFNKIIDNIDEKIKNISVCDPAIGSGAFTVSLMNKIVKIRSFLALLKNKNTQKYLLKKNFIENCMYGVDIEPSAVDTAKLRLWLSLIVDEDKIENIHQLPNLDFKIMQGNSIIDEYNNIKLDLSFFSDTLEIVSDKSIIDEKINKIKKIKKNLLYIDDYKIKNTKKDEINKLIYDILKVKLKSFKNFNRATKENLKEILDRKIRKNFFAWEIYFSEIFEIKKGFDIVITNPPYKSYGLRSAGSLKKDEKELIKKIYPNSAEYKISFYAIFMDLCLRLLNNTGTKILIVPDSFLLGIYFSKIRSLILRNSNIKFISFFTYKIFEADVGYSVIYMADKKKDDQNKITSNHIPTELNLLKHSFKSFSYPQSYFENLGHKKFRLFFDVETMDLVKKIEFNNMQLSTYLTGHTGIRSKIGKEEIISKVKKNQFFQKGLVSSSQILKFKIFYNEDWISTNPKILWSGGFDKSVIEKKKILMRQTSDSPISAIDEKKYYHLNNIHSFSHRNGEINLECLLGYLNSKIFKFYYQNISLEKKRVMAQIDIENIENLKIKKFNNQFQNIVKKSVIQIQILNKNENNEEEINKLVSLLDSKFYEYYNLTLEEINLIESFINS